MSDIDTKYQVFCYKCKKLVSHIEAGTKISRQETCPHCMASLRCCKMCQFYDLTAYNECKENIAERIIDKEKANFCDYFLLSNGQKQTGPGKQALFNAADALFKK